MLAQSFLSADELQITEAQKDALIKTLVLMETGKLRHVPGDIEGIEDSGSFTGHFNMSTWREMTECGTVCCIAGTAELVGNIGFDGWCNIDGLCGLFAPIGLEWIQITVAQGAVALRSYLTTGHANWSAAMGEA